MDREVISIGSSSLKDTCSGSSDNESFSSERLRVSRRTGGGTSRLHGRTRHSTASGEIVPVTLILPLLLPGESGKVVAVEMSGRFPMCDIAIVLGYHCLHLPLLAMSR